MSASGSTNPLSRSSSPRGPTKSLSDRLLNLQIHIHTLCIIAALNLLVLLIWHFSTIRLAEKYELPPGWEEDFKQQQMGEGKVLIWSTMFILVPVDIGYSLWCLGWYQRRLDPERWAEVEKKKKKDKRDVRGTSEREWMRTALGKFKRRKSEDIEIGKHTQNHDGENSAQDTHVATQSDSISSFHNTTFPSSGSLRLTLTYTLLHLLTLSFHTAFFLLTIHPNLLFCHSPLITHPSPFPPPAPYPFNPEYQKPGHKVPEPMSAYDRCQRVNWNIWCAGGFSSAAACVLGVLRAVGGVVAVIGFFAGRNMAQKEMESRSRKWEGRGNTHGDCEVTSVSTRNKINLSMRRRYAEDGGILGGNDGAEESDSKEDGRMQ